MEGTEDPEGQRQKELMLRGESYDASCKLLVLEREKAHDTCFDFNNTRNEKDRLRIIRELKITFPEDSEPWIVPPFYCDYGYNIHLGKDVFINFNCVFLDVVKISLGDNCLMGPGVQVRYICQITLRFAKVFLFFFPLSNVVRCIQRGILWTTSSVPRSSKMPVR
uniref:Maltose/galactoside acetyltransferase domain-containing protein n=1 Tax=Rhodosorus marinus TaxID=101924 RepID=A0A7S3EIX8_9RHOD|mmetsp:Transcript_40001/g.159123  ORF Transcript_40001/g.159123 Transcript_40001/m.159123 type:complete len:165 (+) Transcript_40001:328-822(+)